MTRDTQWSAYSACIKLILAKHRTYSLLVVCLRNETGAFSTITEQNGNRWGEAGEAAFVCCLGGTWARLKITKANMWWLAFSVGFAYCKVEHFKSSHSNVPVYKWTRGSVDHGQIELNTTSSYQVFEKNNYFIILYKFESLSIWGKHYFDIPREREICGFVHYERAR